MLTPMLTDYEQGIKQAALALDKRWPEHVLYLLDQVEQLRRDRDILLGELAKAKIRNQELEKTK